MKKILIMCMVLTQGVASFAQKYAVIDAEAKYKEACANQAEINFKKLDEAWKTIEACMENEKSKDYYDTYRVAALIKNVTVSQLYNKGRESGNLDTLAYFTGLKEILGYYSTEDRLLHTPNDKGKLPLKEDETKKAHTLAQQSALPLRQNMLLGGSALVNSNPQKAIELIDVYLKSFDDPLYKELNLNERDTLKSAAYLYTGMALKNMAQTWEDTLNYLSYYEKVIDTQAYGAYSCVEIMNTYKRHGDIANWEKFCKMAMEKFPEDQQYPKLLIQEYVNSNRKDEALAVCEQMSKAFPKEIFPLETRALMMFNDKKYKESIDLFKQLTELDPTYGRAWCSLGTSYYQLAMENKDNYKVCKEYLDLAIPAYKKAEEVEPDNPALWGYYLYHCYKALSDKTNEAKYKKYEKQ